MMLQLRVNILFLSCCWLVSFSVLTGYNGTIFAYGQVHEHRPTNITVIVKNSSPHRQSADCWLSVGRLLVICRPTVGDLSADCRRSVGRLLADSWPTVDQHLTDSWPTDLFRFFWKDNFLQDICWPQSTDCRLTVGDLSVRCWQSVGNFMPIVALKGVWFTTLDNCIEKIKWNSQ